MLTGRFAPRGTRTSVQCARFTSHEGTHMALDDYLDSEVAVAVAATAVALSPRARRLLRRGAVYGVAGALKATDVVTAAARGVASGVSSEGEQTAASDGRAEQSAGVTGSTA